MEHDKIDFPTAKGILLKKINEETNKDKKLISAEELANSDIPEVDWLVKDIIPEKGAVIWGGDTGHLKSFTALHLSLNAVDNKQFLEHIETKKIKILYVDEENRAITLKTRLLKLKKGHNIINLNGLIFAISHNIKLDTNDDRQRLLEHHIKECKPDLVIIDSMVRFLVGDENSANDVKKAFDTIKPLIERYGTSFLILHHLRKGGSNQKHDLRGSSDFSAFVDVVMMIRKLKEKGKYVISQEKNRHKECIEPVVFNVIDVDDGIKLEYIGVKRPEKSVVDFCAERILEWIMENGIKEFETPQIKNTMKAKGYNVNAIHSALSKLVGMGHISKIVRGHYKVEDEVEIDIGS